MQDIKTRLIDLAIQIQQIPAPTFAESRRAELMQSRFSDEGLLDVSIDGTGNVYGRLAGGNGSGDRQAKPLVISAHLDTVFSSETDLSIRREAGKIYGPGIGDNSLGLTALIGLVWMLRERSIPSKGDLWLVADVGEEGLGNLQGMHGVVDRFGDQVTGYLIIEGLALGSIYHRAVGVQRYRIRVETAGGHSWTDYGQPSAIHEIASLINKITTLAVPSQPRTTLNIGTIKGGTGINVLASNAVCELDLRSESSAALEDLVGQFEQLVRGANRQGIHVSAERIGQRPAGEIPANHRLVELARESLEAQGLKASLTSGSTDANIPLSRGIPAIVMGITTGGGTHTLNEYIDIEPIEKGMEQVVRFIRSVFSDQ